MLQYIIKLVAYVKLYVYQKWVVSTPDGGGGGGSQGCSPKFQALL